MDLENTVSNVRTLLASREKEVFELKGHLQDVREVNQSLQEELDQRRARVSPGLQIAEVLIFELIYLRSHPFESVSNPRLPYI